MSVHVFVALLALCSLSSAADPDCEELVQPLEDPSKAPEKWILHVGTSEDEDTFKDLKTVSSSWSEIHFPVNGSEGITEHWGEKRDGKCESGIANVTFSENTFSTSFDINGTLYNHAWKYLKTCPGCMLWSDNSEATKEGGVKTKSRNLYFYTKSNKLEDEQLEFFKKQAACLNFTSEFHFLHGDECSDDNEASTDAPVKEQ